MSIMQIILRQNKLSLTRMWVLLNCHLWPKELENVKPHWYGAKINGLIDRDMHQRRHVLHVFLMDEIESIVPKRLIKYSWNKKNMFLPR